MLTAKPTIMFHVLLLCVLASMLLFDVPRTQDESYHAFADRRCMCCVPNAMDVVSNAAFLLVGWYRLPSLLGAGACLTAFGSAYYHWRPTTERLFWDRMPMTVAFSGVFARSLGISTLSSLVAGAGSVLWWRWTGDLGPYAVFQYGGVAGSAFQHPVPVVVYAAAKLCESRDREIWRLTGGVVSGHTCKHLLAAVACALV